MSNNPNPMIAEAGMDSAKVMVCNERPGSRVTFLVAVYAGRGPAWMGQLP